MPCTPLFPSSCGAPVLGLAGAGVAGVKSLQGWEMSFSTHPKPLDSGEKGYRSHPHSRQCGLTQRQSRRVCSMVHGVGVVWPQTRSK